MVLKYLPIAWLISTLTRDMCKLYSILGIWLDWQSMICTSRINEIHFSFKYNGIQLLTLLWGGRFALKKVVQIFFCCFCCSSSISLPDASSCFRLYGGGAGQPFTTIKSSTFMLLRYCYTTTFHNLFRTVTTPSKSLGWILSIMLC